MAHPKCARRSVKACTSEPAKARRADRAQQRARGQVAPAQAPITEPSPTVFVIKIDESGTHWRHCALSTGHQFRVDVTPTKLEQAVGRLALTQRSQGARIRQVQERRLVRFRNSARLVERFEYAPSDKTPEELLKTTATHCLKLNEGKGFTLTHTPVMVVERLHQVDGEWKMFETSEGAEL